MIREYVIFETVWNRRNHEIRNTNNMRVYVGKDAYLSAGNPLDAIQIYIANNKKRLNPDLIQKPINDKFMLVMQNYNGFDFYFFAYESHLSETMISKDIEITIKTLYGPKPYIAPHRMVAFKPTNVDPATMRLMQSALPMHGGDKCPKCGDAGYKVRTALMCSKGHGIISGF